MKMSVMAGWKFGCIDNTCPPFSTVGASNVRRCQMACLAQDQCRTASFQQSTATCQLFSNSPDQRGNLITDADTTTMMALPETRMPTGKYNYNTEKRK